MADALNPMIPVSQVVPRSLDWLWPERLALGKLAIFEGDPGRGKSLVTLDLCARVTTGRPMPDGTGAAEPASAIVIQGEDFADDTIAPRLKSLGADLARVFIFGSDHLRKTGPFQLPAQIAVLDQALAANKPRLLVIDPIMAFLDRTVLAASDQSIRRALSPLADLADQHHCAMVLVRHLNKNVSYRSLYRGGGSIGFNAACRSSWLFAEDPLDPTRHIMAQIKNNLADAQPTLAYRILRESSAPPRLDWLGPTSWTAEEIAARARRKTELLPRDRACVFLAKVLEAGPLSTDLIWKAAQPERLKRRTIEYARHTLGIRSKRVFDGKSYLTWWLLPGQRLPDSLPPEQRDDEFDIMLAEQCEKYPADPLAPLEENEEVVHNEEQD